MAEPKTTALTNGLVLLDDGTFRRSSILINNGWITRITPEPMPAITSIDCSNFIITPGLVNAHCHSNENWFRGCWDQMPLEPWSLFSYPKLAAPTQTPSEVYVRTLLGAFEMLRTGATSVVDFLLETQGLSVEILDAVVRAYRDIGMRAVIALGMSDLAYHETVVMDERLVSPELIRMLEVERPQSWRAWEAFTRDVVAAYHRPADGISIAIAPSGPQRCSDEMLAGCAGLADELDLVIHIHVLETRMQALSGLRKYGVTLPAHLSELGFLGPRVSFEHGIWMTPGDMRLAADAGLTVVHNPLANLKLGSGLCHIRGLLDAGVSVALGTDGMSSNDGNDMFGVLKTAVLLQRVWDGDYLGWPTTQDLWRSGTIGGARSAGLAESVGRMAIGCKADLLLLDSSSAIFTPLTRPLNQIVLSSASAALDSVMVGGRWTLRHGEVQGVDEPSVLEEARQLGARILARHDRAFELGRQLLDGVRAGWLEAASSTPAVHRLLFPNESAVAP